MFVLGFVLLTAHRQSFGQVLVENAAANDRIAIQENISGIEAEIRRLESEKSIVEREAKLAWELKIEEYQKAEARASEGRLKLRQELMDLYSKLARARGAFEKAALKEQIKEQEAYVKAIEANRIIDQEPKLNTAKIESFAATIREHQSRLSHWRGRLAGLGSSPAPSSAPSVSTTLSGARRSGHGSWNCPYGGHCPGATCRYAGNAAPKPSIADDNDSRTRPTGGSTRQNSRPPPYEASQPAVDRGQTSGLGGSMRYTRPGALYVDERDLRRDIPSIELAKILQDYAISAPLPPNQPGPGNVYGVGGRIYDDRGYLIEFENEEARITYLREMAGVIREDQRRSSTLDWWHYYETTARERIFQDWRAKYLDGTATLKDHPGYGRGGNVNHAGFFTSRDWVEVRKRQDEQMVKDLGGRTHNLVSDTLSWIKLSEDQMARYHTALTGESKETFLEHMDSYQQRHYKSLREGLIRMTLPDNPPYKWENWEEEKQPPKPAASQADATPNNPAPARND